ncbi:Protein kinase-like domain protein [Metarhizium album ARSEF 1941]|uniref:Protein kinase-like domain protein n=1 Tax=Metarhizium album (strain ARSEF 1941) TaxID=1081103 RepID=A0A0B2WH15_METAS|nr:Protein kinase-like domain protein [Metarhizium album ARSEF 1941]KHN95276.1 Protein kinase-like domain protein [Metarhizium album ARSEF 1941]
MAAAGAVRRTSQRQALRRPASRQMVSRSESQAAAGAAGAVTPAASQSPHQQQFHDDSSEDEIPVPMKLSALTKALLNDDAPEPANKGASPPRTRRRTSALNDNNNNNNNDNLASAGVVAAASQDRRHLRSGGVQPPDDKAAKAADTSQNQEASPVRKRVVRLGSNPHSLNQMGPGKRRSTSMSRSMGQKPAASLPSRTGNHHEKPAAAAAEEEEEPGLQPEPRPEVNTPSHPERVVRIAGGSSANQSRVGSSGPSSGRSKFDRSVADRSHLEAEYDRSEAAESALRNSGGGGSASRYPSTRSRADDVNLQSSMRVKRVGKLSGSFLSGPARRGRRRQSDEEGEGHGDGEVAAPSHEAEHGVQPADEVPGSSIYHEAENRDFNSGSPVSGSAAAAAAAAARASHRRQASGIELPDLRSSRRSSRGVQFEAQRVDHITVPEAMLPKRIEIPSTNDQENEYPITFKRPVKVAADAGAEKPSIRPLHVHVGLENAKAASPERKPLASIANNTPHRSAHPPPPPPPPKMSVLEAATSTAGAATTTQARQRRNVLRVNGKCYTRLECLGRGGSAKVYRVTAENGKMFALKRVSLENADDNTIKGYRGEIDLLGKLKGVDRVIDLYDHELNSEKQVLTLTARFDPVFVRFYWKEMLECLQSVHQYEIVHSDLKPANFVLVQGRLKLIDFGIANAIQTEETVNVHRETQVGTPSYMSPESLMDANNPRGGRVPGRPKLVKLGKPSDIWSLGCILYQMVYGVPPFGHIANQMARCQAIINWDHVIEFPSRATGGVPVPPSLLRTMKRCLNRDHHMRPTCEELLHASDPFLYPAEFNEKALPIDEELLGRIIQSVVTRCRERMPTESEGASVWPQAYWTSIRKAMAGRM